MHVVLEARLNETREDKESGIYHDKRQESSN